MRSILTTLWSTSLIVILVAALIVEAPAPAPADTGDRMATAAQAYVGTLNSEGNPAALPLSPPTP